MLGKIEAKVQNQGEPRTFSCDICNKENVPFFISYKLTDNGTKNAFAKFILCEDCSNELANQHYKAVKGA